MKTINEQRDEIMLAVKRAVGDNSVTYEPDSDYCMFSCDDIDHIAEDVADNLIEKWYRKIDFASDTQKAFKEGYKCGRADESNTAKNEIDALRDELRRVSEG